MGTRVPSIYVLSKNEKKNIIFFFHLKIIHFTTVKIAVYLLHWACLRNVLNESLLFYCIFFQNLVQNQHDWIEQGKKGLVCLRFENDNGRLIFSVFLIYMSHVT